MRKIIIAGNWKMYKNVPEAVDLVRGLKAKVVLIKKTGIIVCPPATNLTSVFEAIQDTNITMGAQNIHWEEEGAYTGENSARMIKSTGATYVIIGHSERRQYFAETDETVNKKLHTVLKNGLKAIVCVGETLEERESGITKDVVKTQVSGALQGVQPNRMQDIIIAYEPVWAIGTGKTATPDQAQDVHAYIRSLVKDLYDENIAENLTIQYGGSVKPENAGELLSQADIDGALVGGACLKADSFSSIIETAEAL
jgi:triosephosphate isomerase